MAVTAHLFPFFQFWTPGYAAATLTIYRAGTFELANVFYDVDLEEEAENPQTLETLSENGETYGKLARVLYTNQPYWFQVDGDQSGVIYPPITDLTNQDASYALSATQRATRLRRLLDRFADEIRAEDFGEIGDSAAVNTTTLTRAIGAAAAQGGGVVLLPDANFLINTINLPAGVILRGVARQGTTIRSQEGEAVVTISGDLAGLMDMTLDGVTKVAGSIGVKAVGINEIIFANVDVKRFESGIRLAGGRNCAWEDLLVTACTRGIELRGDTDASNGAQGDEWTNNLWIGGKVQQCTEYGLKLNFEDTSVRHNTFSGLGFEDNIGIALVINGARFTRFDSCYWDGNATNSDVHDDTDTSLASLNTVNGLLIADSRLNEGDCDFDGQCLGVLFDRCEISDVAFSMSLPINEILLRDCTEDADVTVTGDVSKVVRNESNSVTQVSGVTTDAVATTAWAKRLAPGQIATLVAKVIANRRNGEEFAAYTISARVRRRGSVLPFDGQSVNFTVGTVLTGATSGATARILAQTDAGATGTLVLRDIDGTFEDNETITDTGGGTAVVNGAITNRDTGFLTGTLAYDGQTVNYTVGDVVTGNTSGTSAVVTADSDGGATGTLTLRDIANGLFTDNETLVSNTGGTALVNSATGVAAHQTALEAAQEMDADYNAYIVCSGAEVRVMVVGKAAHTIEWDVRVDYQEAG